MTERRTDPMPLTRARALAHRRRRAASLAIAATIAACGDPVRKRRCGARRVHAVPAEGRRDLGALRRDRRAPKTARARDPTARRIAIHVAIVPALATKPDADALFVLAGGPGQAATDVAGLVVPVFAKINRSRDLVFVDQRGTGGSNPLTCADDASGDALADAFDPGRSGGIGARAARCAERLAAHADLTRYTTPIAMQDLDDVRARLGYPTIDLWAASYGTRAALEYARQFPDRIRTMTLDGVAPAWRKLPLSFGVDTHAAIAGVVAACARETACARAHPHLGDDIASAVRATVRAADRRRGDEPGHGPPAAGHRHGGRLRADAARAALRRAHRVAAAGRGRRRDARRLRPARDARRHVRDRHRRAPRARHAPVGRLRRGRRGDHRRRHRGGAGRGGAQRRRRPAESVRHAVRRRVPALCARWPHGARRAGLLRAADRQARARTSRRCCCPAASTRRRRRPTRPRSRGR